MGVLSGLGANLGQIIKTVSAGNTSSRGVAGQLAANFKKGDSAPPEGIPESSDSSDSSSATLAKSLENTPNENAPNSFSKSVASPATKTVTKDEAETKTPVPAKEDYRVRLQALAGQEEAVYGKSGDKNILSILHDTKGLLFPFTPSIAFSQTVDYESAGRLVHTNFDTLSFARSNTVELNVTGKFTVQNQREGEYMLAVLHFLRVASKMYFGSEDAKAGKAGLPPPVLMFSGYGKYMFNKVRCVLKSHSYSFEENVDKVHVKVPSGSVKLPALLSISMTLGVVQSPIAQRDIFSLEKFRTGELMDGGGWI